MVVPLAISNAQFLNLTPETNMEVFNPIQVKLFDKEGHPYTGNSEPPVVAPPMKNAFPAEVIHEYKTFIFDPDLSHVHNAPSYRMIKTQP
jgi:hypothetical protein